MFADVTRPLAADQTALLGEENPGVKATENLFDDFLSTCSGGRVPLFALKPICRGGGSCAQLRPGRGR